MSLSRKLLEGKRARRAEPRRPAPRPGPRGCCDGYSGAPLTFYETAMIRPKATHRKTCNCILLLRDWDWLFTR